MLKWLDILRRQGRQYIPDLVEARPSAEFRGWPQLVAHSCGAECASCRSVCPTGALTIHPLQIDLGLCLLCGECQRACPHGAITFTPHPHLASSQRQRLVVGAGMEHATYMAQAVTCRAEVRRLFGRSLKLRSVSAGGCNACEMELNACGNVNFDMGRFGIDIVASPRHADGVVITGPVSANMASALDDTLLSIPEPRLVIAAGACAISGGLFAASPALDRHFFANHAVDLYIPGCPVHPLTMVSGLLQWLGRAEVG